MTHATDWNSALAAELRELGARQQRRELAVLRGINLCSNDYLALSTHPALRQAVVEAVLRTERLGSTGSRLLSGHTCEWEELEAEFANFSGTEGALFFGSGYAANLGLLGSVLRRGDMVFSDVLNHASLIDGMRLSGAARVIYPHCDLDRLEAMLRDHSHSPARKLIVTESVFSVDGDVAPLEQIHSLAEQYGAALVVDEAHATGTFGPEGRGRLAQAGLEREAFASVHTCGKALASAGAFVCCSAKLKELLINRARPFLFSTALPPYFAAQVRAALALARKAESERARLQEMAAHLRRSVQAAGFDTGCSHSQIVPVILGENGVALEYASALEECGFAVRAIRPPTVPAGTARLRLSLTCALGAREIERLGQTLAAISVQVRTASAAKS
jgi:8-amino-7-oxononanoate synthase